MNAPSLATAMRRFAAIALVLAPLARGYAIDSVVLADQSAGRHAGAHVIVLAQGRCFNGRCY